MVMMEHSRASIRCTTREPSLSQTQSQTQTQTQTPSTTLYSKSLQLRPFCVEITLFVKPLEAVAPKDIPLQCHCLASWKGSGRHGLDVAQGGQHHWHARVVRAQHLGNHTLESGQVFHNLWGKGNHEV